MAAYSIIDHPNQILMLLQKQVILQFSDLLIDMTIFLTQKFI